MNKNACSEVYQVLQYLPEVECEILKPYFIGARNDVSIKDYIEVNSAISLALAGLGNGIAGINFKDKTFSDSIPDWLKVEVGGITNQVNNSMDVESIYSNISDKLRETVAVAAEGVYD